MASLAEIKRRAMIPLIGVGLAAYYVLVFLPLDHRARSLDVPLDKAWQGLATSLGRPKSAAIDFGSISNQLEATMAIGVNINPGALIPKLDIPQIMGTSAKLHSIK